MPRLRLYGSGLLRMHRADRGAMLLARGPGDGRWADLLGVRGGARWL